MQILFDRSDRGWNLMDRTLDRYIWNDSMPFVNGEKETVNIVLQDKVVQEWLSMNGQNKMVSSITRDNLKVTYGQAEIMYGMDYYKARRIYTSDTNHS